MQFAASFPTQGAIGHLQTPTRLLYTIISPPLLPSPPPTYVCTRIHTHTHTFRTVKCSKLRSSTLGKFDFLRRPLNILHCHSVQDQVAAAEEEAG